MSNRKEVHCRCGEREGGREWCSVGKLNMNGWMTYKGSISLRLESGNSLSIDRITPNFGVNVGRTFVWSLGLRSFLVHSASVHSTEVQIKVCMSC